MVKISDNGSRPEAGQDAKCAAPRTAARAEDDALSAHPVRAPHYTELVDHGPVELARIVAAKHTWLRTNGGSLLDPCGVQIAGTIEDAATAMSLLGWFDGDGDGELWIDWEAAPDGDAPTADAVRSWLAGHDARSVRDLATH